MNQRGKRMSLAGCSTSARRTTGPSLPLGGLTGVRVCVKPLGALLLLLLTACSNLEGLLDKLAPPPGRLASQEQGYVEFDDTGNILVAMNNLEFSTNPLFSEGSYIGAWVYKRGANARAVCCYDGFESLCPTEQEDACMIGVAFSNDLAFAGNFYLHVRPPKPFPRNAAAFHMPVYVADKSGIPQNYQGEYNTFSSPVNAVGDREVYDLYLGVYYNVADGTGLRPINKEAEVVSGTLFYYSAARPDYMSPVIPIESRFFPESTTDRKGSWYPIPHLASWSTVVPGASLDLKGVVINEIGIDFGGGTNNDFVELYNTNSYAVDLTLAGGTIMRDDNCTISGGSVTQKTTLNGVIPANGYFVIARSSATAALPNVSQFWDTSNGGNITGDYCIILTSSKTAPTSATSGNVIDFVATTGGTDSEGGVFAPVPAAGQSVGRCPNGQDTNVNNVDFPAATNTPTPGAANTCPP